MQACGTYTLPPHGDDCGVVRMRGELKIENWELKAEKVHPFHYEKSRNEKMRNRGQVLYDGGIADCHIKNRPTATSKLDEDTEFLEIIRVYFLV